MFRIILIVSLIASFVIWLNMPRRDKEEKVRYSNIVVSKDGDIDEVSWISNEKLQYRSGEQIVRYNIKERESEEIYKNSSENTQLIMNQKNPDLFCTWENHIKKEVSDIGTTIKIVHSKEGARKEFRIKETVKIEVCDNEKVYLSEAFPFMQSQSYILDINSGMVKKGDNSDKNDEYSLVRKSGWCEVFDGQRKRILGFKCIGNITMFKLSANKQSIAYIDENGNLWVYGPN